MYAAGRLYAYVRKDARACEHQDHAEHRVRGNPRRGFAIPTLSI
jgi:hypothetical protein